VIALMAATIQRFHDLFVVVKGSEEGLCSKLQEYGRALSALSRRDVLCATQSVAEALLHQLILKDGNAQAAASRRPFPSPNTF
jgi:hypothetical protein